MKQICSNCSYWQRCPTIVDGCEPEMICGYSKNAAYGLNGQDGRAIITPPEFGCILWKAKREPAPESDPLEAESAIPCRNCGQTNAEHTPVTQWCFQGSDEFYEPIEFCAHGRTDHGICIECGEIREFNSDDFGKRWVAGKLIKCPQPEDQPRRADKGRGGGP